jgi:acetyltransferase-like isoleucine patch superfamily enzyme
MLIRKIRSHMARMISKMSSFIYRRMGVEIGKNCFISLHARLDIRRGKIILGDNVQIGSGSYILSHTGFQPLKEGMTTVIEDNVKIYVHSIVLPGVKIGKNSVVGAGSVVMKDVPPNVLVMGNPARVVQRLEDQD